MQEESSPITKRSFKDYIRIFLCGFIMGGADVVPGVSGGTMAFILGIYDELVEFIKEKKKERQIIIVTHNANIVLGADAEEVIIANRDGEKTKNKDRKFEYRSGSLENCEPIKDNAGEIEKGILNSQGIQNHICDILEGGRQAFSERRNKYRI